MSESQNVTVKKVHTSMQGPKVRSRLVWTQPIRWIPTWAQGSSSARARTVLWWMMLIRNRDSSQILKTAASSSFTGSCSMCERLSQGDVLLEIDGVQPSAQLSGNHRADVLGSCSRSCQKMCWQRLWGDLGEDRLGEAGLMPVLSV